MEFEEKLRNALGVVRMFGGFVGGFGMNKGPLTINCSSVLILKAFDDKAEALRLVLNSQNFVKVEFELVVS
jgi:hypothetical protein